MVDVLSCLSEKKKKSAKKLWWRKSQIYRKKHKKDLKVVYASWRLVPTFLWEMTKWEPDVMSQ